MGLNFVNCSMELFSIWTKNRTDILKSVLLQFSEERDHDFEICEIKQQDVSSEV